MTPDQFLNDHLKMELATRHNNFSVGSGLGGHPGLLFFMMTHPTTITTSNNEEVNISMNENLIIEIPSSFLENKKDEELSADLKKVRHALLTFCQNHPDFISDLSQDKLANSNFLSSFPVLTSDIQVLLEAYQLAQSLGERLKNNVDYQQQRELNKSQENQKGHFNVNLQDKEDFQKLYQFPAFAKTLAIRFFIGLEMVAFSDLIIP
jgi:hypothetical protein